MLTIRDPKSSPRYLSEVQDMPIRRKRRKRRNPHDDFSLGVLRLEPRRVLTVNAALSGIAGDVLNVDLDGLNEIATISRMADNLQVSDSNGNVVGSFQQADVNELKIAGDNSAGQNAILTGAEISLARGLNASGTTSFLVNTQISTGASSQIDVTGRLEFFAGSSLDVSGNNKDLSLAFGELSVDPTASISTGDGNLSLLVRNVSSLGVGGRTDGAAIISESFLTNTIDVHGYVSISGDDPDLLLRIRDTQLMAATYDLTLRSNTIVIGGDATEQNLEIDDQDGEFSSGGFVASVGGWRGSIHSSGANQGNTAQWLSSALPNGEYLLAATWTADVQNASNAQFVVDNGNSTESFEVDQRLQPDEFTINAMSWRNLGVVSVVKGALSVSISDVGRNGTVVADAIRLARIDTGVVLDNTSTGFSHTGFSKNVNGVFGDAVAASPGSASANWSYSGLANGVYAVNASWIANATATSSATFSVTTASQTANATFDQRSSPNSFIDGGIGWAQIGFAQVSDGTLTVQLDTSGADNLVLADVVRIERATPDLALGQGHAVSFIAESSVQRDVGNNRGGVIDANRLTITAGKTIGAKEAPIVASVSEVEATSLGDVHFAMLKDTTVTETDLDGVTSSSGNVVWTSPSRLILEGIVRGNNVAMRAAAVHVQSGVAAKSGDLEIASLGSITATASAVLTQSGLGSITLSAMSPGGAVSFADGSILTATGDVTIDANRDIQIGHVKSNKTVRVRSMEGGLVDSGELHVDVVANKLMVESAKGIGGLETRVSHVSFVNTSDDLVQFHNDGALNLVTPETTSQNRTMGDALLVASSPLTVSADISVGGSLTLTASGDCTVIGDDVTIAATVSLSSTTAATIR
ncbi:MAG: hypothetical protein ABGX22_17895, partial [Pirellulaceae bacterium]